MRLPHEGVSANTVTSRVSVQGGQEGNLVQCDSVANVGLKLESLTHSNLF